MKEAGRDSWQRETWRQSLSDGLVGIFLTPDDNLLGASFSLARSQSKENEFQLPHEGADTELANYQHLTVHFLHAGRLINIC